MSHNFSCFQIKWSVSSFGCLCERSSQDDKLYFWLIFVRIVFVDLSVFRRSESVLQSLPRLMLQEEHRQLWATENKFQNLNVVILCEVIVCTHVDCLMPAPVSSRRFWHAGSTVFSLIIACSMKLCLSARVLKMMSSCWDHQLKTVVFEIRIFTDSHESPTDYPLQTCSSVSKYCSIHLRAAQWSYTQWHLADQGK